MDGDIIYIMVYHQEILPQKLVEWFANSTTKIAQQKKAAWEQLV